MNEICRNAGYRHGSPADVDSVALSCHVANMRVYTRTMNGSCYCVLLRKASRKVSSVYDEALAPLGVNIAQFSLMRNIARAEPVSLTDLATRLELDRSTVGRNAKVLERMGWVGTSRGKDQREAVLTLTAEGRRILEEGAPLWDEAQSDIETKLGPKAVETLHALLDAL